MLKKFRTLLLAGIAAGTLVVSGIMVASADTHSHGQPQGVCVGVDEPGFGSRDGFQSFHILNVGVSNSLVELDGWISNCHTNLDNAATGIAESAQGGAKAVKVTSAYRTLLRAQLQRWNGTSFVTVVQSDAVNSGSARTVSVVTPTLYEPTVPAFVPGWYRVNVRELTRYGNAVGPLVLQVRATYPIWLGDGPASPLAPPA